MADCWVEVDDASGGLAEMTDKPRDNEEPAEDNRESAASAIFAAIMRDAAEKARPKDAPPVKRDLNDDATLNEADGASPAELDAAAHDQQPRAAAIEYQRIRRVNRQPWHRRQTAKGTVGGFFRTTFIVLLSTGLVATLLTFFTNPESINPAVVQGLELVEADLFAKAGAAVTATPVATPKWNYRIGIISGHRGSDSGAICSGEGGRVLLREVDINFSVATRVLANLKAENYTVDLLDESDPRLDNYQADALVSIHANTCLDFGELVTGYIIAKPESRPDHGPDAFLRECVALNYGALVPLQRSYNLTDDMTNYHVWRKIHPLTPGVILEMGYMLADQEILTTQHDLLAHAITNGIRCFLEASGAAQAAPSANRSAGYLVPVIATPTPSRRY